METVFAGKVVLIMIIGAAAEGLNANVGLSILVVFFLLLFKVAGNMPTIIFVRKKELQERKNRSKLEMKNKKKNGEGKYKHAINVPRNPN